MPEEMIHESTGLLQAWEHVGIRENCDSRLLASIAYSLLSIAMALDAIEERASLGSAATVASDERPEGAQR